MTIPEFIKKLRNPEQEITFQDTMDVIENNYHFAPSSFANGNLVNQKGENSGSCKLFSFAKLQQLSKEETLYCFGSYYKDVLDTPEGNDHQNIRNFIKTGWQGVSLTEEALSKK